MPVEGIDVSKHQGAIDWEAVAADGAARIKFVYIRASYGDDPKYERRFGANWEGARSIGLLAGAYHYFLPRKNPSEVGKQAQLFLDQFEQAVPPNEVGYLPPVLDVEEPLGSLSPAEYVRGLKRWIDLVERSPRFAGQRIVIYTSRKNWSEIGNPGGFSDRLLWVPDYSQDPPRLPEGWNEYRFFQYTDSGKVGNIAPCDRDRFDGTLKDLKKLTKKRLAKRKLTTESQGKTRKRSTKKGGASKRGVKRRK